MSKTRTTAGGQNALCFATFSTLRTFTRPFAAVWHHVVERVPHRSVCLLRGCGDAEYGTVLLIRSDQLHKDAVLSPLMNIRTLRCSLALQSTPVVRLNSTLRGVFSPRVSALHFTVTHLVGYTSKYMMNAWKQMSESFSTDVVGEGMASDVLKMWIGRFDANIDIRHDWQ